MSNGLPFIQLWMAGTIYKYNDRKLRINKVTYYDRRFS